MVMYACPPYTVHSNRPRPAVVLAVEEGVVVSVRVLVVVAVELNVLVIEVVFEDVCVVVTLIVTEVLKLVDGVVV